MVGDLITAISLASGGVRAAVVMLDNFEHVAFYPGPDLKSAPAPTCFLLVNIDTVTGIYTGMEYF